MKRSAGLIAASVVLAGSTVVATSSTASAYTTYGPYRSKTVCERYRADIKVGPGQRVGPCYEVVATKFTPGGWSFRLLP